MSLTPSRARVGDWGSGVGEDAGPRSHPLIPNAEPLRQRAVQRIGGHLAAARISNSPTVVSNVLAGAALAGGLHDVPALLLVGVAMVCLYTAGMYLNDVFDYASDCIRRPQRPLPLGLVSRREAAVVGAGLLALGSVLLLPLGPAAFASGVALVAVIVAYDLWHKTNPLSPLVMAACRIMVYVTAYLALGPALGGANASPVPLLVACVLLGSYLVGLTYVSKVEDQWAATRPVRPADSEPASRVLGEPVEGPTARLAHRERIGDPVGRVFLHYWPAVLVLLPVAYFAAFAASGWVAGLLGFFTAWAVSALSLVYRPANRDIGGAIGRLIAGISLLDGLVLVASGWGVGVVVALLAFGGTHVLQRYVKGT
jgi:UbiA prenyltransferase family